MAYQDSNGKNFSSKFRANRSSRAQSEKGPRSQANAIEATPENKTASKGGPSTGASEGASAGATKKAADLHITHDHEANHHHVRATDHDGSVMHDQDYPSAGEAHKAAAKMGGAEPDQDDEGNFTREQPDTEYPDADDFAPQLM